MIDLSSKSAKKDLKAFAKSKPTDLTETLVAAMARPKLASTAVEVAKKTKVALPVDALLGALRFEQTMEEAQALAGLIAARAREPGVTDGLVAALESTDMKTFWKSSAAVGWALRGIEGEAVTESLLVVARAAVPDRAAAPAMELLERVLWVLRERPSHPEIAALAEPLVDVSEQAAIASVMHGTPAVGGPLYAMFLDPARAPKMHIALKKRPAVLLGWARASQDAMRAGAPEGEAFALAVEREAPKLFDEIGGDWAPIVSDLIARAPVRIAEAMAVVGDWMRADLAASHAVTEALLVRARRGELIKQLLWWARNPHDAVVPLLVELLASPEHGTRALADLENQTPRVALAALKQVAASGVTLPAAVAERLPSSIEKLTPAPRRVVADDALDASALARAIDEADVEVVQRALAAGIGPTSWRGEVTALHAAVRAWTRNEHEPMIAIVEALVAAGFDPTAKLPHALEDDEDWTESWRKGESPRSYAESLHDGMKTGAILFERERRDARHTKELITALGG